MNILSCPDSSRPRIAAVGMWDGVHRGHRFLIDHVRAQGKRRGLTPAVVTFAAHPLTVVRPEAVPPLLSDRQERMALLDAAGVDDCILLDFDSKMRRMTAREFLTMLKDKYAVATLMVGFNNRFGRDRAEGVEAYAAIGREIGLEVIPAPEFSLRRKPVSSSRVRALIAEGNVDGAAALLGRPFTITGRVASGRQLGRTRGFPTANIEMPSEELLVPGPGAYAAVIRTPDGVRRGAMVNIGRRPTVDRPDAPVTIEAHIFDYAGEIYGQDVTLEFLRFLRPERRFDNVEALRRQLVRDERQSRRIVAKEAKIR